MEEALRLLGTQLCPFNLRVIWALKLKGIAYEFIEEDLSNKSPLLLQSNPIHKRIPVLIHGEKPISESSIILEYMEEIWPQSYPLLPTDPYERAMARFWIKFADDKGSILWKVYKLSGEERNKAIEESLEILKTIEHDVLGEKKFFGGDKISMVDVAFGGLAYWSDVIEKVLSIKLVEAHEFPRLLAWIKNFKEAPGIKENFPDLDHILKTKT